MILRRPGAQLGINVAEFVKVTVSQGVYLYNAEFIVRLSTVGKHTTLTMSNGDTCVVSDPAEWQKILDTIGSK